MKDSHRVNVHPRWNARVPGPAAFIASILLASCAGLPVPETPAAGATRDMAVPPPPTVLQNKENSSAYFRADSDLDGTCQLKPGDKGLEGEITYSGLVKLGTNRWVFLRDTKDCSDRNTPDLMHKYFGILTKEGDKLSATEVEFDLSKLSRNSDERPSDLEAFCLIESPTASSDSFELIAVASGGFRPVQYRKLFRVGFSKRGDTWHAEIRGRAEYHSLIGQKDGAPTDFEAEGMLCSAGPGEKFSVVLADRGTHEIRNGESIGGHGGGLLRLEVDFPDPPGESVTRLVQGDYVEIVAPHCNRQSDSAVDKGEWRDIAALHRRDGKVWASATFEGEVGAGNAYCSTIYQLCDSADCGDLLSGAPKRTVVGVEVQGLKVEGIADGAAANALAIATDEEASGLINLEFPLPNSLLDKTVIVVHRTKNLERAAHAALFAADPSKVLVVFDLDNTLLTMKQDLGSVPWYDWQDQINGGAWPGQAAMRVGAHTGELLKVQGLLYELAGMEPTQPNVAKLVQELHEKGVTVYVLTARGPDFQFATRRELDVAGIDLTGAPECLGPACARRGVVPAAQVESAVKSELDDGVPDEDMVLPILQAQGAPRMISIDRGVMMVAGQNKGVMLRLLLKHLPGDPFDTVIFVDDSLGNVINVAEQSGAISEDTRVYHYARLEDDVADFFRDDGDKGILPARNQRQAEVAESWERIRQAICRHDWGQRCPVTLD